MDDGTKPTPRIFTISEVDELGYAIHDLQIKTSRHALF